MRVYAIMWDGVVNKFEFTRVRVFVSSQLSVCVCVCVHTSGSDV